MLNIIIYSLINLFLGFAIGRLGDKFCGRLNIPHHWIYGYLLIITGIIYLDNSIGIFCLSFGIGYFISDFNDFLNMRLCGADKPHRWKFWNID